MEKDFDSAATVINQDMTTRIVGRDKGINHDRELHRPHRPLHHRHGKGPHRLRRLHHFGRQSLLRAIKEKAKGTTGKENQKEKERRGKMAVTAGLRVKIVVPRPKRNSSGLTMAQSCLGSVMIRLTEFVECATIISLVFAKRMQQTV